MAISISGTPTTPEFSTGNPSVDYTGIAAVSAILLMFVHTKPDSAPADTPAGWELLGARASATGIAQGNDAGDTRVGVFYKISDGTETVVTPNIPSNNVSGVWGCGYTCDSGLFETPILISGADNSTGNNVFQGIFPATDFKLGDRLAVAGTMPTDAATAATTTAVTGWTSQHSKSIASASNKTTAARDMAILGNLLFRTAADASQTITVGCTAITGTTATYGPLVGVIIREQAAAPALTAQKAGPVPIF